MGGRQGHRTLYMQYNCQERESNFKKTATSQNLMMLMTQAQRPAAAKDLVRIRFGLNSGSFKYCSFTTFRQFSGMCSLSQLINACRKSSTCRVKGLTAMSPFWLQRKFQDPKLKSAFRTGATKAQWHAALIPLFGLFRLYSMKLELATDTFKTSSVPGKTFCASSGGAHGLKKRKAGKQKQKHMPSALRFTFLCITNTFFPA